MFLATSNYMNITSSIERNMHSLTCTIPAMVTLNANKNWFIVGNISLNGNLPITMGTVYNEEFNIKIFNDLGDIYIIKNNKNIVISY